MSVAALQSTQQPWVHLWILREGQQADLSHAVPPGFVVKTIAGTKCKTKTGLFHEFARALAFPDYFGHNWDALEECLIDLEWLPGRGYVIVVSEAHHVLKQPDEEDDYATLIEILTGAGEAWSTRSLRGGIDTHIPFHTVLTVPLAHRHERKNWLVPQLAMDDKDHAPSTIARRKRRRT